MATSSLRCVRGVNGEERSLRDLSRNCLLRHLDLVAALYSNTPVVACALTMAVRLPLRIA